MNDELELFLVNSFFVFFFLKARIGNINTPGNGNRPRNAGFSPVLIIGECLGVWQREWEGLRPAPEVLGWVPDSASVDYFGPGSAWGWCTHHGHRSVCTQHGVGWRPLGFFETPEVARAVSSSREFRVSLCQTCSCFLRQNPLLSIPLHGPSPLLWLRKTSFQCKRIMARFSSVNTDFVSEPILLVWASDSEEKALEIGNVKRNVYLIGRAQNRGSAVKLVKLSPPNDFHSPSTTMAILHATLWCGTQCIHHSVLGHFSLFNPSVCANVFLFQDLFIV